MLRNRLGRFPILSDRHPRTREAPGRPEGPRMLDPTVLPAFIAVILVFLIPPGPDMTYMVAVGLEGGRRAAVVAILGIATGMAVYAAAVVLGVGHLAQEHPGVLVAIKLLGALYLLWLAVSTIRSRAHAGAAADAPTGGRWYLRGLTVSLTNPKLMLFFVAVLPGFLGRAGNATAQMGMLGAVNVAMETLLYGTIGVFAGTFHARVSGQGRAQRILSWVAASVYLLLAVVIGAEAVMDAMG